MLVERLKFVSFFGFLFRLFRGFLGFLLGFGFFGLFFLLKRVLFRGLFLNWLLSGEGVGRFNIHRLEKFAGRGIWRRRISSFG